MASPAREAYLGLIQPCTCICILIQNTENRTRDVFTPFPKRKVFSSKKDFFIVNHKSTWTGIHKKCSINKNIRDPHEEGNNQYKESKENILVQGNTFGVSKLW